LCISLTGFHAFISVFSAEHPSDVRFFDHTSTRRAGRRNPQIAPQMQGRRPPTCTSVVADPPILARRPPGRPPLTCSPISRSTEGRQCTSVAADPRSASFAADPSEAVRPTPPRPFSGQRHPRVARCDGRWVAEDRCTRPSGSALASTT
jgi:hypothetical protein